MATGMGGRKRAGKMPFLAAVWLRHLRLSPCRDGSALNAEALIYIVKHIDNYNELIL